MIRVDRPHQLRVPSINRQACVVRSPSVSPLAPVFSRRVETLLDGLPAPMRVAVMDLYHRGARGKGFACPTDWRPDTVQMMVGAIHDACLALADYRHSVSDIPSLATLDAVKLIGNRVRDGLWSEINLVRILTVIRKLHRVATGSSPPYLTRSINRLGRRARRRNQWHLVRTPGEYIRGGWAVFAFGEIATAAGKLHRGRSLRRDGALLACAAETNLRRGDYHHADRSKVRFRPDERGGHAEINLPASVTKHGVAVSGAVYDPDALEMLKVVREEGMSDALFGNGRGGRLSKTSIGACLRRAGMLSLGDPATANLLRRSGVTSEETAEAKARRLSKPLGARTGLELSAYNGSMAEKGHLAIRAGLASYLPK